jgi:hypothetical protein
MNQCDFNSEHVYMMGFPCFPHCFCSLADLSPAERAEFEHDHLFFTADDDASSTPSATANHSHSSHQSDRGHHHQGDSGNHHPSDNHNANQHKHHMHHSESAMRAAALLASVRTNAMLTLMHLRVARASTQRADLIVAAHTQRFASPFSPGYSPASSASSSSWPSSSSSSSSSASAYAGTDPIAASLYARAHRARRMAVAHLAALKACVRTQGDPAYVSRAPPPASSSS